MLSFNRFGFGPVLFRVKQSIEQQRLSVMYAGLFNAIGVGSHTVVMHQNASFGPAAVSIGVGCAVFAFGYSSKSRQHPGLLDLFFVVNGLAVSFALWHFYAGYTAENVGGVTFQAAKLGALVAGLLAPNLLVGAVTIGIHIGLAYIQLLLLSPEIRTAIGASEPLAIFSFGLGGLFVLLHRMRIMQMQEEMLVTTSRIEATRAVAKEFLALRDLMNTPLQSVEIAVALIKTEDVAQQETIRSLRKSTQRLIEISQSLKRFENDLKWED